MKVQKSCQLIWFYCGHYNIITCEWCTFKFRANLNKIVEISFQDLHAVPKIKIVIWFVISATG